MVTFAWTGKESFGKYAAAARRPHIITTISSRIFISRVKGNLQGRLVCGPSACFGSARESAGHMLSEDFDFKISLAQANSGVNES